MYYFLTHTINEDLPGLEIAMLKRLKIFKYLNEPAKIMLINFNRQLHKSIQKNGLTDDDIVSLYDYFQGTIKLPADFVPQNNMETLTERFITAFTTPLIIEDRGSERALLDQDTKEPRITLKPLSSDWNSVTEVSWWDRDGKVIRFDGYDSRGFLSMSTFYSQDGGVASETAYKLDGTPVINSYYHADADGNVQNTLLTLIGSDGAEMSFPDFDHLAAYFYDQVVGADSTPVTMIADRAYAVDPAMFLMQEPVRKLEYWHNTFTTNYEVGGPIGDVMQNEFRHREQMMGYIVSTERAAHDLRQRVPAGMHVYTIPVALNEQHHPWVPMSERQPDKMILIGRIEQQKNLPAAIRAINIIKEQVTTIRLQIYGYILEADTNQEVHKLVDELGLQDNIIFKNYTHDKDAIYQDAQLLIMTSRNEGWGMALDEALTYCVPIVSFDVDYGPADIVTDGADGYIVPQNDIDGLAAKCLGLLKNDAQRDDFGQAAQNNSQRFNLEPMAEHWRVLLQQIKSEA